MATLEELVIVVDGDASGATSALGDLERTADRSASNTGASLDRVTEGFDTTDTRAMGLADTVGGLSDTFTGLTDSSLPLNERLMLLGGGVSDLASGFVNFLIPALGKTVAAMGAWIASLARGTVALARNLAAVIAQRIALIAGAIATGVVTAAQWLWNLAMMANPIGLIIAAVIAFLVILGLLAKNWSKITAFLREVWQRTWSGITSFFQNAWSRITSGLARAVAFVRAMLATFPLIVGAAVSQIGSFLSGIWDGITAGLSAALNGAIGLINTAIAGINLLIQGANAVPGVSIPFIPSIPYLAQGGIVTGPTLAMIGEGVNDEAVIPLPRGMRDGLLGGGGATEVRIVLEGDEDLVRLFRRGIADRGGNVQDVLGTAA
jgi:phage-related protein